MKDQTREQLKQEISDLKEQHKKDLLIASATGKAQGAINMAALMMKYLNDTIGTIPKAEQGTKHGKVVKFRDADGNEVFSKEAENVVNKEKPEEKS